ncbi:transposase [Liquorilactobacillus nagelii]|uniref:transposase n=1 Tax=Liquorilactobacillus nagelii TaxID=82688 RepID=UPI0021C25B95|nr:transposase [Liquorilactobacillus nagelii]MCP9316147.1 transposase [Liquorilactobacillus nagelii]
MATKYDIDFKKMIVSLYQNGEKVKDLTSEYGISDKNIYAWIKRYSKDKQTGINQDEYLKLKKAYQKIQEENEILKKVLTIFAKN